MTMKIVEMFGITYTDSIGLMIKNVLTILIIIIAAMMLAQMTKRLIKKLNRSSEKFDDTLVPVIISSANTGIFILTTIIILDKLGVNTNSLIAVLGTAGLAIGLALKDTLSNVAAGIVILVLRPFKVGQFIDFNGVNGTVKKVSFLYTELSNPESIYVFVPNSCIWGAPLKNFSRNPSRRLDLIVGISYTDSIDKGFEVFQNIIDTEPRFLKDPAPQMMVHAMADSSVNLQLRAWLSIDDYWPAYWELNKIVKTKIEEAGLTIPFPQRSITITNEK